MKKISIMLLVSFILLSGCTNKEEGESSTSSLIQSQPTFTHSTPRIGQPTTTSEDKEDDGLLASFSSSSQDKQLVLYRSDVSSLTAKTYGGCTSNVPISKDWEKYVEKESNKDAYMRRIQLAEAH